MDVHRHHRNTTTRPQWRFREMQPGEINIDPIEGEFFTTEALGSLNDALVREAIQNSLDAAVGEGPVTVRFAFHQRTVAPPAAKESQFRWLDGLGDHLQVRHAGLQDIPPLEDDFDYLLIEDYGTRGLQGDIRQYDDLDDGLQRNDFYYFWRNIGRTRKGEADIGRWGLGKTVFQAASRINTFFGLTVRGDDGRTMLMGQSVLKIHKLNGRRYSPYGFFGRFEGALPLPVEDEGQTAAFVGRFGLERRGKPGLSILIPYPDGDIQPSGTLQSVIAHYLFPILSGRLIVALRFADKAYEIDAASLDGILKRSQWPAKKGLPGLIGLARWAIRQPSDAYIRLKAPPEGRAQKLTTDLFAMEQLTRATQCFMEGRRLAFQVPLSFQQKGRQTITPAFFAVYLEKDEALDKAEDHFIRQGITIPEVSSLKHKGIRAIVSITDPALSSFLGDAENPAHTEWERNSRKFKMKYIRGPSTLDFVKTSPREIVKILTRPPKGRDKNLLRHLFALGAKTEDPAGKGSRKAKGEDPGQGAEDIFVGVEGAAYLRLSAIKGGFRLMRRTGTPKVPRYITVWMAYEVRSGNPFKKYTTLDFDVGQAPVRIHSEGCRLLLAKQNAVQIEVLQGDFRLTVTGFDTHRDLRVKTLP